MRHRILVSVPQCIGHSLRFDRVLCDVPCSGDGTLRKAPDLWRRWSDGLGLGVHRMQLAILLRGMQVSRLWPRTSPSVLAHLPCVLAA